jgi:ABC-2 type transport system ATP-binding protein
MDDQRPALRLVGLRKQFGRPAVDGLDLLVRRGEFYALLGPNGAGKTTTLRLVTGLLAPDAGTIEVLGVDMTAAPAAAKAKLAYLPDEPMLYGKLKPFEYLEFVAGLWGVAAQDAEPRARELLDWLDLSQHAHELTEGFSRGMKQKLALAGALIHDPELLILDEPLTGLDAAAARQVKDLLLAHVAKGGTVILTTHILEVAERLAHALRERTQGGSLEDMFLHLMAAP